MGFVILYYVRETIQSLSAFIIFSFLLLQPDKPKWMIFNFNIVTIVSLITGNICFIGSRFHFNSVCLWQRIVILCKDIHIFLSNRL